MSRFITFEVWRFIIAALWATVAVFSAPSFAHGELHDQIASLDRRIAENPKDAALYLRRAELHRIHREWAAGDADYAKVLSLEPAHPEVVRLRARERLEAGKAGAALADLDRYLKKFPDHASARLTRARALAALGRYREAARDYGLALDRLPEPAPDYFLEQRDAQHAAGLPPAVQLASLDKGLRRLGPVPSIEDAALEIELRERRWDDALARLDRQAQTAARKEQWQYRRGLVLVQAGRSEAAIEAFRASLADIDRLAPVLRSAPAVTQLAQQVHWELQKLGADKESGKS